MFEEVVAEEKEDDGIKGDEAVADIFKEFEIKSEISCQNLGNKFPRKVERKLKDSVREPENEEN